MGRALFRLWLCNSTVYITLLGPAGPHGLPEGCVVTRTVTHCAQAMISVSSVVALHTGSVAAPPVLPAGPASPSSARSWECQTLRHILQVSDTLLCPYSVSLIVPGGCAGTAAGGWQRGDQDYTVCSWWGSWFGVRCWDYLLGTGMAVGFFWAFVWAGESAGCVCTSWGMEWAL